MNTENKINRDETAFAVALMVVLLLIIPALPLGKYGGGMAMVAVSVLGAAAYLVLFGARLRQQNRLKPMATVAVLSFVTAIITVLALNWRG